MSKKTLMGLDPGYRTGCKLVIINKDGFYETNDVLFLVEGVHNPKQLETAKKKILDYIKNTMLILLQLEMERLLVKLKVLWQML